jgi:myo-inositol-1(or 4)-monophosphatase
LTAVDTASEALVVGGHARRPADDGSGEEGHARAGTSGVRWIVDPIDGTVNFLYGYPAYAVSIAAEVDGRGRGRGGAQRRHRRALLGDGGRGASCEAPGPAPVRLTGSRPESLGRRWSPPGFGYRVEQRRAQGAVVAELLPRVRDIRAGGSSAIDLCTRGRRAGGRLLRARPQPWDHAAGALVAAEAGLVVTGLAGRPFAEPDGRRGGARRSPGPSSTCWPSSTAAEAAPASAAAAAPPSGWRAQRLAPSAGVASGFHSAR